MHAIAVAPVFGFKYASGKKMKITEIAATLSILSAWDFSMHRRNPKNAITEVAAYSVLRIFWEFTKG